MIRSHDRKPINQGSGRDAQVLATDPNPLFAHATKQRIRVLRVQEDVPLVEVDKRLDESRVALGQRER
jgi:hypothetical protein